MTNVFYKAVSYDAKSGRYNLRLAARFDKEKAIACLLGLGVSALIVLGCSVDFLVGG